MTPGTLTPILGITFPNAQNVNAYRNEANSLTFTREEADILTGMEADYEYIKEQ